MAHERTDGLRLHVEAIQAARAADTVEAVEWVVTEDSDPERVMTDLVTQANAGAALTHALYHSGKDFMSTLPAPVIRAYIAACRAYQIGRHYHGASGR